MKKLQYNLSTQQKSCLLQSENEGVIEVVSSFSCSLDKEKLTRSIIECISIHDIYKTVFPEVTGQAFPFQVVDPELIKDFASYISYVNEPVQLQVNHQKPFHFMVIEKGDEFEVHLIISSLLADGFSVIMLINEISQVYAGLKSPEEQTISYAQYSDWMNDLIENPENEAINFWRNQQYEKYLLKAHPFFESIWTEDSKIESGIHQKDLDQNMLRKLNEASEKLGMPLDHILLTLWARLLCFHTDQDKITIGYVPFLRKFTELGKTHGNLSKQIPIVFESDTNRIDHPFQNEKLLINQAIEMSDFIDCVNTINIPVSFQSIHTGKENEFEIKRFVDTSCLNKLKLIFIQTKNPFFEITYNSLEIEHNSIELLTEQYVQLINAYLSESKQVSDLFSDSDDRIYHLLNRSNESKSKTPGSILDLFLNTCKTYPDKTAIVQGESILTYTQLNEQSDLACQYLLSRNVSGVIGLQSSRTIDFFVNMIGILKADCAFLPIDFSNPSNRIAKILEDSKTTMILIEDQSIIENHSSSIKDICYKPHGELTRGEKVEVTRTENSLTYVMYTSGSTGEPKGVEISDKSICHYVWWLREGMNLNEEDKTPLLVSPSFDLGYTAIWGSLLLGGELHLLPEEAVFDTSYLLKYFKENSLTFLKLTPSIFKTIVESRDLAEMGETLSFKQIFIGGEKIDYQDIVSYKKVNPQTVFINHYGPTETTIGAIAERIDRLENSYSIIGCPIGQNRAFVLDQNCEKVPTGFIGELYIGGPGVGKGYHNNLKLSKDRFVDLPNINKGKLYRTGDLVKLLPSGKLSFIKRKDNQVKLRGYRVELGEIESVAKSIPRLQNAVCVIVEGQIGLCYTCESNGSIDEKYLDSFFINELPSYMVPEIFVEVKSIPITKVGKVDYDKLQSLCKQQKERAQNYVPPRNVVEEQLCQAFGKILTKEKIGIDENFFTIGGDSIKVIRLINELKNLTNSQISVKDIYQNPTVILLSKYLDEGENSQPGNSNNQIESQLEEFKKEILQNPEYSNSLPDDMEDFFWVSDIEIGMIYHSIQHKGSGVYHDQAYYQFLDDDFNFNLFKKALELLVEKHEILRTSFHLTPFPEPIQVVHAHSTENLDIAYQDISDLDSASQKSFLEDYLDEDRKRSFELTSNHQWRARIFKITNQSYGFIWISHHAILDGWSNASLITELSNLYYPLKENKPIEMAKLNSSYKDLIIAERKAKLDASIYQYWKTKLNGYSRTPLPYYRQRLPEQKNASETFRFEVDSLLVSQALLFAQTNKISLRSIILSAFVSIIKYSSNTSDITLGVVTHKRPSQEDGDKVLGCFLNRIPFRTTIDGRVDLQSLVRQIDRELIELYSNNSLTLPEIIKAIGESTTSENPIYDISFDYTDFHIETQTHTNVKTEVPVLAGHVSANTLMDFFVGVDGDKIGFTFAYNKGHYDKEEIEKICNMVCQVIALISEDGHDCVRIDQYLEDPLLLKAKKMGIGPSIQHSEKLLYQIVEQNARECPKRIALEFGESKISYQSLNQRSNRIAHHLIDTLNAEKNSVISVALNRSNMNVEVIMAIHKAGCIYLPIDTEFPSERIRQVLLDANPSILITESDYLMDFPFFEGRILALDIEEESLPQRIENPQRVTTINDPAYCIYTSGTTGIPKGVLVAHRGYMNMAQEQVRLFGIEPDDRIMQFASLSFDASLSEIAMALVGQATLVVRDDECIKTEENFITFLNEKSISVVTLPPSFLGVLTSEKLGMLRLLIMAGEEADYKKVQTLNNKIKLFNAYGPTEYSVCATAFEISGTSKPDEVVPIGRPIANTDVFCLSDDYQIVPIGVVGQIFIAGKGLAQGYLNLVEQTDRKFFEIEEIGLAYDTGDRGYWDQDGNLVFIGRSDNQIKVNGRRIELGEIERRILQIDQVSQAACLTLKGSNKIHAAFSGSVELNPDTLKSALRSFLPDYMIPDQLIQLESLPLMINGKIDRRELIKKFDEHKIDHVITVPQTPVQETLLEVWKETLGITQISTEDSFFNLGGDSIMVIKLISRIERSFGVRLEISQVFDHDTIISQEGLLSEANPSSKPAIVPVEEQDYYSLSFAQRRLWVLDQYENTKSSYTINNIQQLEGEINVQILQKAFVNLINKYDILRTVFISISGEPKQKVLDKIDDQDLVIELVSLEKENDVKEQLSALLFIESTAIIDLSSFPLFRLKLYRLDEFRHVFLFNIHHIISDGWSSDLFVDELMGGYEQLIKNDEVKIESLAIQYKDYLAWQNRIINEPKSDSHKNFWHQQLQGELPKLTLRGTNPRPSIQSFNGNILTLAFDEQTSRNFNSFLKNHDVELFPGLVYIVALCLYKHSGQQDVIMGTPVASRDYLELENQIGFFVNTIVLRNRIDPDSTVSELLKKIKSNTLSCFDHQGYPFDLLVEELSIARDISRSPIFDVMITYSSEKGSAETVEPGGISIQPYERKYHSSKFDLSFIFSQEDDQLFLTIEYNTDIFEAGYIEQISNRLVRITEESFENPNSKIKDIRYLTDQELTIVKKQSLGPEVRSKNQSVIELIKVSANNCPQETAIQYQHQVRTFKELDELSDRIARHLVEAVGIRKGDRVGLMVSHSDLMILSILGIFKSGGIYLPIDVNCPTERLKTIFEDSAVSTIIIDQNDDGIRTDISGYSIVNARSVMEQSCEGWIPVEINEQDPAYVIYTSGSTGKPRGVLVSHENLLNTLSDKVSFFNLPRKVSMPLLAAHTFDISLFEIFLPLIAGGTCQVWDRNLMLEPESLGKILKDNNVIHAVPSLMNELCDISENIQVDHVKVIFTGGDKVPGSLLEKVSNTFTSANVYVLYGPTEGTIICSSLKVNPKTGRENRFLIGYPHQGCILGVIDEDNNPLPTGMEGELVIGGKSVSMGYLNNPELTHDKYKFNVTQLSERIYKTGDQAKFTLDKGIQFLGRLDNQVKIRGYRIELDEIERILGSHPQTEQSAVIAANQPMSNGVQSLELLALFQAKLSRPSEKELKDYLREFLPEYMIPYRIVLLESMPLNQNGKIDRKKLSEYQVEKVQVKPDVPKKELEKIIERVWCEVLGLDHIELNDNFFEIGGDSIKAIQVSSKLFELGYKIEVREILSNPTIGDLSPLIQFTSNTVDQTPVHGNVPLSPIQKRFFDHQYLNPNYYNQSNFITVPVTIYAEQCKEIFTELVNHHDVLRMTYSKQYKQVIQFNRAIDEVRPEIQEVDLSHRTDAVWEDVVNQINALQSSLNIYKGRIIGGILFKLKDHHSLFIAIHHLVIDTVSWKILLEDFQTLVNQKTSGKPFILPPKTHSFKLWMEKLEEYSIMENNKQEIKYWNEVSEQVKTAHTLIEDKLPLPGKRSGAKSLSVVLDPQQTSFLLKEANAAYSTNPIELILSATVGAFSEYFQTTSIPIDMEGHGREEIIPGINLSRTIGWFTSIFPIIFSSSDDDLGLLIKETKDRFRSVPNNGVGYGILRYLSDQKLGEGKTSPLSTPAISFNFHGEVSGDLSEVEKGSSKIIDISMDNDRDHMFEITSVIVEGKLSYTLTFDAKQFSDNSIKDLLARFSQLLISIIDYCIGREKTEKTASDFTFKNLSGKDLSTIQKTLKKL